MAGPGSQGWRWTRPTILLSRRLFTLQGLLLVLVLDSLAASTAAVPSWAFNPSAHPHPHGVWLAAVSADSATCEAASSALAAPTAAASRYRCLASTFFEVLDGNAGMTRPREWGRDGEAIMNVNKNTVRIKWDEDCLGVCDAKVLVHQLLPSKWNPKVTKDGGWRQLFKEYSVK